jgi:iron complex transport system permease protein
MTAAPSTTLTQTWRTPLTLVLAAGVLAAFALSIATGPLGMGFGADRASRWLIFSQIRLPRACLGALVGAGLGIAGAALQGYLRNPLAEPGVLGISGGSALGAVLAIHSGLAGAVAWSVPVAGLIGAAITTALLLRLAGPRSGPITLLLAGVALASLAGALTSLALNVSATPFATVEMLFWLMGSLADRSVVHVAVAAPLLMLGMFQLWRVGTVLDALTLGEDTTRTLGLDLEAARRRLVLGVALTVGAATATAGTIGFVGLIVPHLLRPWVGQRPSALLCASALGGAILVLCADVAVRLLAPFVDLRIGVLTALLGAPFFLWLVVGFKRDYAP